jgi:hypothetical protein
MVEHPPPSCLEVVDTKEQPDSTCVLAADGMDLCAPSDSARSSPVCASSGLATTQRFGRPSFVVAGESSTRLNANASTKNRMVSS